MLSTDDHDPRVARPADPRRGLVLAQAWWPSTRALADRTVAGALAMAIVPSLVVAAQGGRSHTGALVIAALVLGAVMAFAVEDPAEETLAASPTSLARRRLLRLGALVLGAAVVATVVVGMAIGRTDLTSADLSDRPGVLAAVSGLAMALAAAARRRDLPGAVHGGAVAAVLVVLLVASLANRYASLPGILGGPHVERWWWLAAAGWLATAWTWRDPAR